MKIILYLFAFTALLFVGCADDSTDLTSTGVQMTQQSDSPNWIKLPADLEQGFGVETEYSAEKRIKGRKGGDIKLKVKIHQHGNKLGDHFEIKAKVKVQKHSFPDNEERVFTITFDTENVSLTISPSPNTLDKHVIVDLEIKGIDLTGIDPNSIDFFFVDDNDELLETSKDQLKVEINKHKIKVKKAFIYPTTTASTPPGSRYAFIRS
jgi:hypothetical protein